MIPARTLAELLGARERLADVLADALERAATEEIIGTASELAEFESTLAEAQAQVDTLDALIADIQNHVWPQHPTTSH